MASNGISSEGNTSCEICIKSHRRHGMTKSREYGSWDSMIQRCTNQRKDNYQNYGGKGITVCDRWLESFENFFADMGPRPEGTSLDRIDVNGNYEPSNCRWASDSQQLFNRKAYSNNTSGRTGVNWDAYSGKWTAKISKNGKRVNLGLFTSFEEAVAAREAAELEVYGYIKEKDGLTQPPPNAKVLSQTGEQTEDPVVKQ